MIPAADVTSHVSGRRMDGTTLVGSTASRRARCAPAALRLSGASSTASILVLCGRPSGSRASWRVEEFPHGEIHQP